MKKRFSVRKKRLSVRRYTDLPALIAILSQRQITLLPPSSWDDRNDRHFMEAYKRAKKRKTLLALCFSQAKETYHHWRVFAPGNSGVSIMFDRDALVSALPKTGITCSSVDYKTIKELMSSKIKVDDLPFVKRAAFKDEKEFRIVFSSTEKDLAYKNMPIELSTINRIAINPWLPESLYESTKKIIRSIEGCRGLKVYQSELIDSPFWRSFAGKYA